ncbi:MFS alpha-glucoside transporter [Colletotrichum karsti]|uniref:MFS alpha-glucoside transporter n=1 Tax=Colletotrichum karsti TaxID=1095194 RepID=A0A9P6I1G8_9PEZI|nr:MFS alpha-glucoside transporter [Colletotrichum karsti]KAF9875232.1 MFS alpha-glucoside transporter [Colletotrichum karsti]
MKDAETGQPQSVAKARSRSFDHHEYGAYTPDVALIEAAAAASDEEAQLSRKELFSKYWPAVVYSTLLSLALVMEGMDVGLINNFFGHTAYLNKFGWPDANGIQHIPTSWQAAIGNGNNLGSIVGLLLNGWLQSRYGSRKVYMGAMALMGCTIFALFFSVNVQMLFAANILCGIPWGIFQTLTTAYAAEICPAALRGYLTAWVSMCWGAGSFLAAGVLRGSLNLPGDLGWRVPYALQWVWILPLILVGFLAPESPWYLVRRGKLEEAEKSLRRLACKNHYTEETMAQTLALMKHTNEMEKIEAESASYRDCFRGTNLRRTGIVCMAWVIQILNGQSICTYATVFLKAAGMPEVQAFNYSMGIQSVNIVGTGVAIFLMGKVGRRIFYLYGSSIIGGAMLVIGIMGFVPGAKNVALAVAVVLIIVNLTFKTSLGPTCYVIVAETSSSRVRAQTIVLGRAIYVCGQVIVQQLNPRMLNDTADAWNWGAKAGMFYFGLCLIWAVWIFFFLPETKNRTFAELDYLFQKKISARKFATAPIDLFEFTGGDKLQDNAEDIPREKTL